MAREAGKGSGRRPSEVSKEVVDANWDRIFGKKNTNIDNEIERLNQPTPPRDFDNQWVAPVVEEIYDPHLTVNS
jgi:hypothetical protein